ncbi:MAG: hypothetical protein HQK91_06720 [Nitrospirae bacterium]|nr:hypothetical protein [Nitrospirota bacterium]MBF0541126.1 hypothetical protein [Nitrospirota bacterium]
MNNEEYNNFRKIIELSRDFVEKHNGFWEHSDWQEFLLTVEKNGIPITTSMETFLGSVVESMKDFYTHLDNSIGITNAMMNMAEHTIRHVTDTKGVWDHLKWEDFLYNYQNKMLLDLRNESISTLGKVLETSRSFYQALFNLNK